jgi:hypothetical protein
MSFQDASLKRKITNPDVRPVYRAIADLFLENGFNGTAVTQQHACRLTSYGFD